MNLKICYLKIHVSREASVNFHHISHKMPCRPRNLHLVATWRSPGNGIRKKHATRHVWSAPPVTQNDDGGRQSAAPATKNAMHLLKTSQKKIAPATQNDFRRVTKHVWMSRSATPATRNEATRQWKPPTVTTFAQLAIGTAIRSSRDRPRTVANGCATSGEHSLNPQTPRVKREPLLRIREKYWDMMNCLGNIFPQTLHTSTVFKSRLQ